MNNIILGYERMTPNGHPISNFNGRYLPNSIKYPNNIIDNWNPTLKQWYKQLITPELCSDNELDPHFLFYFVNNKKHEYKSVIDIPAGVKYIYPIHVYSMFLYAYYVSEISISPKVRNDVLRGDASIVFIYTTEGDILHFKEKFKNLVDKLKLPKENVFLFHGDLDASRFVNENYTYVPITELHWWISGLSNHTIVADESKIEKLYLCYNRTLRDHKLLFLAHLANSNLIDNGIISAGIFDKEHLHNLNKHIKLSETAEQKLLSLSGKSPDNKKFPDDNPAVETTKNHYDKTFISVTVETLEHTLFFSEKTFKPIMHRHPFIIVGMTGMLKKLKGYGFQTFDKWWDESYDDEPTMNQRIIKIIGILEHLNKLTIGELKNLRKEIKPVLDYNYQLLQTMYDNKDYIYFSEVFKEMQKISNQNN